MRLRCRLDETLFSLFLLINSWAVYVIGPGPVMTAVRDEVKNI